MRFLGFERPGLKALLTIGGALLFLALVLVLAPERGLWGLLLAQALQAGVTLAVGLAVLAWVILRPFGGRFQLDLLKEVVSYGARALGFGLFQMAIEPVIRLVVNAFGGPAAVAVVELAARLIATARGLIVSIGPNPGSCLRTGRRWKIRPRDASLAL